MNNWEGRISLNSAEIFSQNVKNALKRKGMKLKELAECIGMSASYLSLILNNSRGNLSDAYRDKIAAVLGVSVADLYTEAEEDGEDVIQIIDTQQHVTDRERVFQLETLDSVLKLLEEGYPDIKTAFYYGFGSLAEEEAVIVVRFLQKVAEKYLFLRKTEALPPNQYDPVNFQQRPGNNKASELQKIYGELSDVSRRILTAAAIAGDGCSLAILEELTGFDRESIKFYLRELVEAALVGMEETMEGVAVRFRDQTVERTVYHLINPARRAKIHRQVAQFLEDTAGGNYHTIAIIANHYQKAGHIIKFKEYCLKAAESAYALAQYRHSLKHFADAAALLSYEKQDDELAQIYQRMGTIHCQLFNEEEALRCQEIALKLYFKLKDHGGTAYVLSEIGSIWFFRGEIRKAIMSFEKSLAILRDPNTKNQLYGQVLIRLGSAYGRQEELERAQAYYHEAVTFAAEKEYPDILGKAFIGLGLIAKKQGSWEKAIGYFVEALQVAENDGLKRTKAVALGNLGVAYLEKGNLEEAIMTLSKSFELHDQAGDARYRAYASTAIAKAYLQKGDLGEAMRFAKEILPVLRQAREEAEMAEAYRIIAHIKRLKKEWKDAIKFFEESLRLLQGCKWKADSQKITEQLAETYYDLGSTFEEKGDVERGRMYHRKAYDLYAQYRLDIKHLQEQYLRFNPLFLS